VIAPLCVLAVPLYDAVSVIGIRIYQGRSPFLPDKYHFSHRLVSHSLSPRAAVLTIYLTTFATGLGALLLYRIEHWTGAVVVSMIVLCVLGIIAILEMAASRSRKK
jgi:UDP-GlcNAc:undecaprenyl-phosphate GlcNAc-1-phosphate transferase